MLELERIIVEMVPDCSTPTVGSAENGAEAMTAYIGQLSRRHAASQNIHS
jgi:hypothetical protein